MQHVKLFEQFVTETMELSSAYPYSVVSLGSPDSSHLDAAAFKFTGKTGVEYYVDFTEDYTSDPPRYVLGFAPRGGDYYSVTNANDAARVFATVAKIFRDLIEKYELQPYSIEVKGSPKPSSGVRPGERSFDETARDRIYKSIARREISNLRSFKNPLISGYDFIDNGGWGFVLRPKVYDMADDGWETIKQ